MENGKRYNSTREAALKLGPGFTRSTIKRYLNDPKKLDWYRLEDEQQPFGCSPIFASKNGGPSVFSPSLQACLEAGGFITSKLDFSRKVKKETPGFRYAHFDDKTNKHIRTPYTLRPGDRLYTTTYPDCPPC